MGDLSIASHFTQLTQAPLWQTGQSCTLRCTKVIQETVDVHSYYFQGVTPVRFVFKPGQFVNVKVEIEGKTHYRSYTIASSPSRPMSLMLTIKRVENGLVSNHLLDTLQLGSLIEVDGPFGEFNLLDIPADKYLFLSAGCGITPMMSMTQWLMDSHSQCDIHFMHCARRDSDILFQRTLNDYAQHEPHFNLSYVLTTPSQQAHYQGRLNQEALQQLVSDLQQRTVLVCGPESFMQSVKDFLQALDFDMDRFHMESFGTQSFSCPTGLEANPQAESFSVAVDNHDKTLQIEAGQSVLDAVQGAGLPIIGACRTGVCGSCKCKKVSGTVNSTSQQTLSADDIEQGYFLACSSTMESDGVIQI